MENEFLPHLGIIEEIWPETWDIKTFRLKFKDSAWNEKFTYKSGQFIEISLFGVGEIPISISSSPTRKKLEISVKKVGVVTSALHDAEIGTTIGIRGPYGNGWPIEKFREKDVLFIGGGIGLAPLKSLIENMLDNRDKYGTLKVLYGARSPEDVVFKDKLEEWAKYCEVLVTVDKADSSWKGHVGVVTTLFNKLDFSNLDNTYVVTCGPPIMINFVILDLLKRGFQDDQIISSLEGMMKCGIGKCGHCSLGNKYVCVDGPVFTYSEIKKIPER